MSYIQEGKSFHIVQNMGGPWIIMWPPAGYGIYCDEKTIALEELARLRRDEVGSQFKLVSLDAVKSEKDKQIVGVVRGTQRDE